MALLGSVRAEWTLAKTMGCQAKRNIVSQGFFNPTRLAVSYPPLRIVRLSGADVQVVTISLDGIVHIPVTSIAKTVADCFKFRNKIGLDIVLEALRDAWRQKKVTMDELWESAQLCRVTNVMRPYLESLV